MNVSLGKPVLALLSAACIAVPAGTPDASAATGPSVSTASTISTTDYFDPLPQTLRLIGGTDNVAQTVSAASVDAATLLALLTFPYHNIYGVTVAVGNAAAAGLQVVLLPLSVATLVGTNQTAQVPAYVQSVVANVAAAIPGIFQAIQAEIEYDINLFSQVFGGGSMLRSAGTADVSAASVDGATLLALLTFPYHNVYGVTVAVGNAAAAALQVVLLPLSVATLVGTNQTDQVPAYVQSTFANAAAAIPGIFQAIQAEIEYDVNLFSQLGGGGTPVAIATTPDAAPQLMKVSIAQAADVAALPEATEPASPDTTTAGQNEPGTDAAAGDNAPTGSGDASVNEKDGSTAESVKEPPKHGADDAAGGDTTVGKSDTHRRANGPRASTSNTGDVPSTASAGASANNAASTEKSGAESAQSEK